MEKVKIASLSVAESTRTSETGRSESEKQLERSAIKNRIRELWGDDAKRAFEIVNCESGFDTQIISRTGDVGLFQINLAAHWSEIVGDSRAEKIKNLQNWEYNVQFAYWLWEKQNWVPWVCSRIKNYK